MGRGRGFGITLKEKLQETRPGADVGWMLNAIPKEVIDKTVTKLANSSHSAVSTRAVAARPVTGKKRVRFAPGTKTQDGFTAKFYSRPEYLIRDPETGKLRPRTEAERNAMGIILEKNRPRPVNPLIVQAYEEPEIDLEEVYDPERPNDYEQYCKERAAKKKRLVEEAKRRRDADIALQNANRLLHVSAGMQLPKVEIEDRDKTPPRAEILSQEMTNIESLEPPPPPPSEPLKKTGLDKAKAMMKKMGWKEGEGMGRRGQGLKGCLVPGRNNSLTMVMDFSRCIRLQNMCDRGNVDNELLGEVRQECERLGPVLDAHLYESKAKELLPEEAVSVFVKFEFPQSAAQAIQLFHGRYFEGRSVVALYFPEQRFDAKDFEYSSEDSQKNKAAQEKLKQEAAESEAGRGTT